MKLKKRMTRYKRRRSRASKYWIDTVQARPMSFSTICHLTQNHNLFHPLMEEKNLLQREHELSNRSCNTIPSTNIFQLLGARKKVFERCTEACPHQMRSPSKRSRPQPTGSTCLAEHGSELT